MSSKPAASDMGSEQGQIALASILLGASLAYSIGTLFDLFPHGIAGEWLWTWHPLPLAIAWAFPLAIAAAVIGVLALHLRGHLGRRGFLASSAGLLMIYVVSFYFVHPEHMTHVVYAILHPDSTGYFQAALLFPTLPDIFSSQYEIMLRDLPNHANTRLPGPLLVFWSAIHFVSSHPDLSATMSSAMPAFGVDEAILTRVTQLPTSYFHAAFLVSIFYAVATAVSVWPVHAFARLVVGPEAAAWVVPFWIFTPALAAFYPTFDPTYPAWSAAIMWALVRGFSRKSPKHLIAASLLTTGAMFFTFAFTAIIAWGGLYYVIWAVAQDRARPEFAREHALVFALYVGPFVVIYALLAAFGHISIIEVFRQGVDVTQGVMARVSYFKWVFFFTWNDFFSFAGMLTSAFFLIHVGRTTRSLRSGRPEQDVEQQTAPLLLAYLLVLIMLVVSGNTLAEVARLWIFLMPMVTIFGTHAMLRMLPSPHVLRWALLAAAALQSLAFRAAYGVLIDARAGF